MTLATIKNLIETSIATKQALLADEVLLAKVGELVENAIRCIRQGGKVIFAGNGGSFADAQHLSAEFLSRFMCDRAP